MTINVLMCGGRRAGKTSILSGIQKNMAQAFPGGSVVLDMKNVGRLITFREETQSIFGYDYEYEDTFLADQKGATMDSTDYACKVYINRRATRFDLNFTDVPGEWFSSRQYQDQLYQRLEAAHVLVIAVDSPHLMEEDGSYHEVFNRAARITEHIMKCFQGNRTARMVLFVPVKSEKYRATPMRPTDRMKDLLEGVKRGYADLIRWLTSDGNDQLYTVGVLPCFTMGGAEFLQFVPPMDPMTGEIEQDDDGNPLQAVGTSPEGIPVMQYQSEYFLLRDQAGMHYYKPEYCEQPLLYILLYLMKMSESRNLLGAIWGAIRGYADNASLEERRNELLPKVCTDSTKGFEVLNDPMGILQ